jgi:hypothetical protein
MKLRMQQYSDLKSQTNNSMHEARRATRVKFPNESKIVKKNGFFVGAQAGSAAGST